MNTKKLLEELGKEFERSLEELSVEKAIEGYERMRRMEWERCMRNTSWGRDL